MNTNMFWKFLVTFVTIIMLAACGPGPTPTPTIDTTPPVITIQGLNPATVVVGGTYVDPGATANDAVDGATLVVTTGTVNTGAIGSYALTYSATDKHGNATSVQRTINVIPVPDTTPPVISLPGSNPFIIQVGTAYVEPGATAMDNVDGNISASVVVTGTVDINTVGTYTRYYNVSDSSGNPAIQMTRTVIVEDTTGPMITVQGFNPDSVMLGGVYTDLGATATDAVDGTRIVITTGFVNTAVLGVNTLTYTSSDSRGNTTVATRTVNVIPVPDTTPPLTSLLGPNPFIIQVGTAYVEPGVTAMDNVDGNISASVVVTGTVDINTVGTYTHYYNVSDSSGNPATQMMRVVEVVAIPMLTTGRIYYPGYDAALAASMGADGAIYTLDLGTNTMTRNWGGYQCPPGGCGVVLPFQIIPSRMGGVAFIDGSNIPCVAISSLTVVNPGCAIPPSSGVNPVDSYDSTQSGDVLVLANGDYSTPAYWQHIEIYLTDNTGYWFQVTSGSVMDSSPVFASAGNKNSTNLKIFFLRGHTEIRQIVVDLVGGIPGVDTSTVLVSDAVDGFRAMSVNVDYSKLAFMRSVGGITHIFVKDLVSGVESDLVAGTDPYWATNGSNLIFYTADGARYAIQPDGTGRVQVPTPSNIAINGVVGAACGDICLAAIVPAPAGY